LDLYKTLGSLIVIAEDGKVHKSSSNIHGMTVFKALEFFIDSGEVQNEIKKLDKFDAMDIDEKS